MKTLHLPLKRCYFEQIRDGTKTEEYRLCTPFWQRRLEGQTFDRIVLTLGYPPAADAARRLERPWRGFSIKTITHPHFGTEPVHVFAINVAAAQAAEIDTQ
ncbi:RNA-binding protein [Variovorax sp. PMC12]|uniref:RNA-binding protein n=1 Tax=Variovorax sp. PMC12 TaxID=2126319 RepID=UPI000D138A6D|nr:RNA-binding protein [Variovorax sp. PMC12]AVQ84828.1 RNA-binding protein [Variovorax sp. PMC12]